MVSDVLHGDGAAVTPVDRALAELREALRNRDAAGHVFVRLNLATDDPDPRAGALYLALAALVRALLEESR